MSGELVSEVTQDPSEQFFFFRDSSPTASILYRRYLRTLNSPIHGEHACRILARLDQVEPHTLQIVEFDYPSYQSYLQEQKITLRRQREEEKTALLVQSVRELATTTPGLGRRRPHRHPFK